MLTILFIDCSLIAYDKIFAVFIDLANTDEKTGASPRGAWSTYRLADKTCMVLEVNALPITRAAKNSRVYKVLIIDETSPIYVTSLT